MHFSTLATVTRRAPFTFPLSSSPRSSIRHTVRSLRLIAFAACFTEIKTGFPFTTTNPRTRKSDRLSDLSHHCAGVRAPD